MIDKIKPSTFYKARNGVIVVMIAPIWETDYWLAYRPPYTIHGALHPTYYENGKAHESSEDPISDWDIIEEVNPVHTCLALWGCKLCPDDGRAAKDRYVESKERECKMEHSHDR